MPEEYCKAFLEGKVKEQCGKVICEENCPYGNQKEIQWYNLDKISICTTKGKIRKRDHPYFVKNLGSLVKA